MTTKQPLLVLAILLLTSFAQQANAKIWRMNKISDYTGNGTTKYGANVGGTPSYPVFAEFTDVQSSSLVINGDTIHLEGCPPGDEYNPATIYKQLTIIGAGYFLDENTSVSNDMLASRIAAITFDNDSKGSQLIGVWVVGGQTTNGYVDINAAGITIKRCKIDNHIKLGLNLYDISLIANYFDNIIDPNGSCLPITSNTSSAPANFVIKNNIFKKPVLIKNGFVVAFIQECHNNVFDCPELVGSPSILLNSNSFKNNILTTPGATVQINAGGNTEGIKYNTSASANQFGTDNNNTIASNITTLFASAGTTDGKYMLNPLSIDNVPGEDGTERGVFGGSAFVNKYSISGLAPIPVIYEITTSGVSDSTGLPVTIKARIIK